MHLTPNPPAPPLHLAKLHGEHPQHTVAREPHQVGEAPQVVMLGCALVAVRRRPVAVGQGVAQHQSGGNRRGAPAGDRPGGTVPPGRACL